MRVLTCASLCVRVYRYLDKEMQAKQTPFQYYLQDSLKQVEGERKEKDELDTPTPYSRQIP